MSDDADPLIASLRRALDLDPRNGPLWLHYADLLVTKGRSADAIAALRLALELGVDEKGAVERLVPLLRESGALAEALIRAEKLLESHPQSESLRLELERIEAARRKERADAEGELQAASGSTDAPRAHDAPARDREGSPSGARAPAKGERDSGDEPPRSARSERDDDELLFEEDADSFEHREIDADGRALAPILPESVDPQDLASQFDWSDLRITFADVAGLDDVKKQIRLRIIAPFEKKAIFRAFRRRSGGGILLYGPPGCGKTFIARATAGECGARFLAVGIHDILDKYWGESERLIHALFEDARRKTPTVIFFDEFDALGASRGRAESQFFKTLVDQLLQEMDGVGGRNEEVLVFAATNVPWNVDSAFRRPGRFDRVLFVPPPDEKARRDILARHIREMPGGDSVAVDEIARKTRLFTGADLVALCERASENALSRSLDSDEIHPVSMDDFRDELERSQSSALEWLATARNYARWSNEGGQFDDLVAFLRREKKW